MSDQSLREVLQGIVNRWDDDKNDYRGRVIILELKAALAAAPSLHKDAKRDFKGRFLVSGMFDYEDGSKRIAMKLWDVSLESLEPAALHKDGLPAKLKHPFSLNQAACPCCYAPDDIHLQIKVHCSLCERERGDK